MKWKIIAVVLLLLLVSGTALATLFSDPRIYGPFECTSCTVSTPAPDSATEAYIRTWAQWQRNNVYFAFKFGPDDKIVVCNATHCTTYQPTNTGFLGGERVPISPAPGGGGGGGTGSGQSGGPDDPFSQCTTVTVKPCTSVSGGGKMCEYQTFLSCPGM